MSPVTGQERTREDDEQRAGDGQPEHEEPWRRRVPEGGRELIPQPVLEPVDQAEKERRSQRRRDPDKGGDADEAQVLSGRWRCLWGAIHPRPARTLEPSSDGTTGAGSQVSRLGARESHFAELLAHELSDAVPWELADLLDRRGNGMGRQHASRAIEEVVGRRRRAGRQDDEAGPDLASVR